LFLGAGIGFNLLDPQGEFAPTAARLAKDLAQHFGIETDSTDLVQISSIVQLRQGRQELENFIRRRLSNLEPDPALQWVATMRWGAIFTTNYDYGIERAYELVSTVRQRPITITKTSELVDTDPRIEVPIYHLHGTLFGPTKPYIVITRNDYRDFRENRRMLFELLKEKFATSTVLYIGYSNQDPNWRQVLDEMAEDFYPSPLPRSYRIAPTTDELENELLRSQNIETINATFEEFYEAIQEVINLDNMDNDRLARERVNIPPDFLDEFDRNPAAVLRFLSSWTYVNQASFNESPNLHDFLRGDRPNLSLIAAGKTFERDIQEEVYEDLLDFATSDIDAVSADIVLAPAAYGVSTLLMTLAVQLVTDRAGQVFMLRPGRPLLEGDVEFACTLFSHSTFFFVDGAGDYSKTLYSLVTHPSPIVSHAMFFLGERLNEWRQCRIKPSTKEFSLEALSDPEINRLLDYLADNNILGALEHLDRNLQFSVIKEKHRKELLVVMRESTEGKSFDAILEDEFHGINDPLSRRLYLVVCCFYQYGALVRDALLAQILGVSITELYDLTGNATEGVVLYDCINEGEGTYAARARHRIIATVVWERCSELGEREQILQTSLDALNLNYGSDKDAFEHLVRSDRLVNDISTLDGKIQFFDKACRKDPQSPYVRQHYARMFLRETRLDLALQQINAAIDLDPRVRVLYHTKGLILSQLAFTEEGTDLARRRLVQAERSFQQGLSMYARDEYSYQGLAELYFGWAKRAPTTSDQASYIAKAEETISEGLRVVRARDSLWVISSQIQEWLGNEPASIAALVAAVESSPGSIFARYLLGRTYRKLGELDKAIEVLEPIITHHFDEFRAFVEYAVALLYLGKTYQEAINVLRHSTLYGLGDPRFIATLGGMLFMVQDFTEASSVFAETDKRNFTSKELYTVQFQPPDPNSLSEMLRIPGTVVEVRAGKAFIETSDYPRFTCPASKYNGVTMRRGLSLTFEPAFTAKGSVAIRPELV
jgi:tetratricopeptide (TPR) repeat protein